MSDELYHFGIKGMKWGIRRYQNSDGSLTPAGEKRYGYKKDGIQTTRGKQKEIKDNYKRNLKNASSKKEKNRIKKKYEDEINKSYNKKYSKIDRMIDRNMYGEAGVRRINDKMNAGKSYDDAHSDEIARRTAKNIAVAVALINGPKIKKKASEVIKKYANQKSMQRANSALKRIGTVKYEKVAKNVYRKVIK